jgi:hypothetical protein
MLKYYSKKINKTESSLVAFGSQDVPLTVVAEKEGLFHDPVLSGSQNQLMPSRLFILFNRFESKLSRSFINEKSRRGGISFDLFSGKGGTNFEPVQGGFVSNH